MRKRISAGAVLALSVILHGCTECAGTPSCTGEPTISYTGEFINHKTGKPVEGVVVEWTRTSGIELDGDIVRASSDARGFFKLQTGSVYVGAATGTLRVTPPAPFPPYFVPNVELSTSTRRGEGGYLGRLVVDPFLIIVGEVHDVTTDSRIADGTVQLRRIRGARADVDVVDLPLAGTRWYWIDPAIVDFGTGLIEAEFEIQIAGDARVFRTTESVPLLYRDGEMAFVLLFIQT
jgi:hypothetical protein